MLLCETLVFVGTTILVLSATVIEVNAQPGPCDSDSPKPQIVITPKKQHGKKPNRKLEKLLQGLMSWSMGPMSEQTPPAPPITWFQPPYYDPLPQDTPSQQYYTPQLPQYAPSQYYKEAPPNYTPSPQYYKPPSSQYFDLSPYDVPKPYYYARKPQYYAPAPQQYAPSASGDREPRRNPNRMEDLFKYLFNF